jgi:type IV pilus assembly protein PilW
MSIANKQQGITLTELMVAISLSLILLSGIIQMFVSSKQSYRTTEGLSRMQENARYTMGVLSKEVRMAGFSPCKQTSNIANVLNNASDDKYNFFDGAVTGYDGDASTFGGDFPAVGTNPGERVAGSDAIRILRGGTESYSVEVHNLVSAEFKLKGDDHTLDPGDIVLVCDATNSSIIQISNSNQNNVTVVHQTGSGSPGNCTKGLGFPVVCTTNGTPYAYNQGSQLVKFESYVYFLGVSASGETNSLYRRKLLADSSGLDNAEELVEGIESMQLVYGEAADASSAAQRYVTADAVTDWNNVVSVRLGLLMHTPDEVARQDDTATYNVVGTEITADTDRRQRYVFTSTIKIRNRGTL